MSIVQSNNAFDPFDIVRRVATVPIFQLPSLAPFYDNTSSYVDVRVDWKETPEAHVFKADLPGMRKEDVRVEVEDNNVLKISGKRIREKEEKNEDKWHRVECGSGKFLRRFRLPANAKVDQVNASMENGVLTITVAKQEVKKPEVKAIEISG